MADNRKPDMIFTPEALLDYKQQPKMPDGKDYSSPEWSDYSRRSIAYESQKASLEEARSVARYLARKRLPLDARFLWTTPLTRPMDVLAPSGGVCSMDRANNTVSVFPEKADDLPASHPIVKAWREVLLAEMQESLLVYEGEQLDADASLKKAEEVGVALRLLAEDDKRRRAVTKEAEEVRQNVGGN